MRAVGLRGDTTIGADREYAGWDAIVDAMSVRSLQGVTTVSACARSSWFVHKIIAYSGSGPKDGRWAHKQRRIVHFLFAA